MMITIIILIIITIILMIMMIHYYHHHHTLNNLSLSFFINRLINFKDRLIRLTISSIYSSIYVSIHPSIYSSIHLCICILVFIYQSISSIFIHLSIHLSHTSIHQSHLIYLLDLSIGSLVKWDGWCPSARILWSRPCRQPIIASHWGMPSGRYINSMVGYLSIYLPIYLW